jgi:hypothetical protein
MPTETTTGETGYRTLLFEAALRAAATAHGLPAACRRRTCRASGTCMLRHQPWNGEIDRGCNPDFSVARAAAEHVEFIRLLDWIDPEGTVYGDIAAPHLEGGNKLGPRPPRAPDAWARAIAAAFGIPVPLRTGKGRPHPEPRRVKDPLPSS